MKKTLSYECDVCDLCKDEEAGGSYKCRLCNADICYTCRDGDGVTVLADNSELCIVGEYCRANIVYCNKCVTKLDAFDDAIPLLDGTAYYELKTLLRDIKDLEAQNKARIEQLKQRYSIIKIMMKLSEQKKASLCEQEKAPPSEKLQNEKLLTLISPVSDGCKVDFEKEIIFPIKPSGHYEPDYANIGNAGYYVTLENGERKFVFSDGVDIKPEPKDSSRTSWCDQRELGS